MRQLLVSYFHVHRTVPRCTVDMDITALEGGRNLMLFLTDDPNLYYPPPGFAVSQDHPFRSWVLDRRPQGLEN